jgi:hypothetical protein
MQFIQKCQGKMATKEHSKYKTLLNIQTSANANLCPPNSIDGPCSPELLLGLDILHASLLGPKEHLHAVAGGMLHLKLWILQKQMDGRAPGRLVVVETDEWSESKMSSC